MSDVPLQKLSVNRLFKKFPAFYRTPSFITSTGTYPEPDESNTQPHILFLYDPLNYKLC